MSVNVINIQLLNYLINNIILSYGTLLIVLLGLFLAVFKKSKSYDFMNIVQMMLIGFVLFTTANGSLIISLLSLFVFVSSPKILKGHVAGVVR